MVNSELGIVLIFEPSWVMLPGAGMPWFWDLVGWFSFPRHDIANSGLRSIFEVVAVGIISRRADRY